MEFGAAVEWEFAAFAGADPAVARGGTRYLDMGAICGKICQTNTVIRITKEY